MKNISKNIIALIILGIAVFIFHNSIQNTFLSLRERSFPCSFLIKYSIGSFDDRFGISEDEFLISIKNAEKIWEDAIDKQLFEYTPNGSLKVNLIYDNRQEVTEKLSDLDFKIESDKIFYDDLYSEYETLGNNYLKEKEAIEMKIIAFQNRQKKYEADVIYWNNHGGAPKKEFNQLNKEADYLKNKAVELNNTQAILSQEVNKINSLASQINDFASSLNIQTKKYNNIGNELGEEFEEGLYTFDNFGKRIDIYQFEDEKNLTRLLAHELGHALSLEHSENPSAIMYRLNVGGDLTLSEDDINMLKEHCKIK